MRLCIDCQQEKEDSGFRKIPVKWTTKGGEVKTWYRFSSYCRDCLNARQRERRRLLPPGTAAQRRRDWRERNPEAFWRYARNRAWRRKGLNFTWDDYQVLLTKQGGRCAICRVPKPTQEVFDVDHDHLTNRIRGLLCNDCNIGLDRFRDDPIRLKRAARYLST